MGQQAAVSARDMEVLSRIMFQGYGEDFNTPLADLRPLSSDLEYVAGLNADARAAFLQAANDHHVIVRVLQVVQRWGKDSGGQADTSWCEQELAAERARIEHAVAHLETVCTALEAAGCPTVVIKSLDHWPDLGSDLDLYTSGDPAKVVEVFEQQFKAEQEKRSWGDRLAGKWNFSIPGLPEFIEVHVRYLGQTGEHRALGERVISRRTPRTLLNHRFWVTAPEERIVISTLQRMYRHFYFRLCDMADSANLLQRNQVEFGELRRAAESGGVWEGVATYLILVMEYAHRYATDVPLPKAIVSAAYSPALRVYLGGNFLRVPKTPAMGLYASQLVNAGLRGDMRAIARLPLLPPLAVSALLAYRLTGSDKGIW